MKQVDLAFLWIKILDFLEYDSSIWEPEYRLNVHNPWTGKRSRHRFDYALAELKIAVEIDGGIRKRFGGRHGQDQDRIKLNLAQLHGWAVFRFSPEMLSRNPETCVKVVYEMAEKRRKEKNES